MHKISQHFEGDAEPDFKLRDIFPHFETASLEVCNLIKYFIQFSGSEVAGSVCGGGTPSSALIAQSAQVVAQSYPFSLFIPPTAHRTIV